MFEIINQQRKIRIDPQAFQNFVDVLTTKIPEAADKTFTVAFISDRRMRELNKRFLGRDSTTDVLSFPTQEEIETIGSPDHFLTFSPASSFLGDIAISVEQAQRQAAENGLTLENEIKQLILHGLLHLCGYDHETDDGEMDARELELRDRFGI